MQNILGTHEDLILYDANGNIRYTFENRGYEIVENHFSDSGVLNKTITIKS